MLKWLFFFFNYGWRLLGGICFIQKVWYGIDNVGHNLAPVDVVDIFPLFIQL